MIIGSLSSLLSVPWATLLCTYTACLNWHQSTDFYWRLACSRCISIDLSPHHTPSSCGELCPKTNDPCICNVLSRRVQTLVVKMHTKCQASHVGWLSLSTTASLHVEWRKGLVPIKMQKTFIACSNGLGFPRSVKMTLLARLWRRNLWSVV